jgi:aryl-alcohol dehydrogenase-like predicted oxidoreductase
MVRSPHSRIYDLVTNRDYHQGLSNVYGKADDEESRKVLRHAIDIGTTFWDT